MCPLDFRPRRPYLLVAPHPRLCQCAQLKSTVNRYRDIEPAEQQPGPNGNLQGSFGCEVKNLAHEIEMSWKLWKLFFIIFNYLYLHQPVDTFGLQPHFFK